jgi:hypothetical protein
MILMLLAACLADIRPDAIEAAPDVGAAERGRALLEAAAEAHGGLEAWNRRASVEVEYRDVWNGVYRLFSPWPEADVSVVHTQTLHTFDSEVRFLGAHEGLTWGLRDGQPLVQREGQPPEDVKSDDVRFILPTMQYFVEFPYRILEAPIVLDAGPAEVNGIRYQTVFATWEDTAPSPRWDQYVIYIHPETGRIDKAHYTVREISRLVTGTMHFEDYRQVDGAWLSHTMIVTAEPGDSLDKALHEVSISAYSFSPAEADAGL